MSVADTSGGSSSLFSSPLSLGAAGAGLGALGLGALIAEGPGQLPSQYSQLEQSVPYLQSQGQTAFGQGTQLEGQGTQALQMAQQGQLTPEQQAQVSTYQTGLTNQARQQFYSMGTNPDQNTAFLSTTANIDTQVNAMAQQEIQSTIQLGLGEVSGGNSLMNTGLGFENAANQALIAAGQAQIQLDQQYSSNLSSAFGAIGSMFGMLGGAAIKAAVPSDIAVKRNITQIGALCDDTPVYRFQYLHSDIWQIGVMAQDIEKFAPDAVVEIHGIKHVDIEKATERAARK
jgi:hypothetical protein